MMSPKSNPENAFFGFPKAEIIINSLLSLSSEKNLVGGLWL